MRNNNKENGAVVVEASIVVTVTVILISIMLYIGMILYQQSLVSIMANQTASNVAQVYGNNLKDPFTGYVDVDKVYQSVTYTSLKNDAYLEVIKRKAAVYSKYRLKSARILAGGVSSVEVDIVKKKNELLKSQIVVTIKDSYDLPLAGFFGSDGLAKFSATGRADCVDILDYLNGAQAIGDPEHVNPAPLFEKNCQVNFVPNKDEGKITHRVLVLKGKSISSSREFTKSVMPTNPHSNKFEFVEWVQSNGSAFTVMTEVNGTMTVYGKWHCTITYDPDGGNVSPTIHKVVMGTQTAFPVPERATYEFDGWYTQKNGQGTRYWDNSTIVTDNVTLYAKWNCIHDYVLQTTTPGTCMEPGIAHYKCDRCGHEKEDEGAYGTHDYRAVRIIGQYCRGPYQKKEVRQCIHCSVAIEQPVPGEHHGWARCNRIHWRGSYGCRDFGGGHGGYYRHTMCEYCGVNTVSLYGWHCEEHLQTICPYHHVPVSEYPCPEPWLK